MGNIDFNLVFKIILAVCGVLFSSIIPLVISLVGSIKKRKEAKTESEKAEAEADLLNTAILLIDSAETLYKNIDKEMKKQGDSAGNVKKDNVMTKLQSYALEKQYDFDVNKWSEVVDNIVKFTKNVNGTNNISNVKVGG